MPTLFQISIEVNSGSVGRIAEQIGQRAMAHGWESYITYARNHQESKSKVIKIGSKLDIYWHGLITRLFDRHCLSSTRATRNLIKQIKEIQPDIIQLHHIHGYFLDMRTLFQYLSSVNIPVVWVFHDCWAITGHCAHFDYINCFKWQTQCKFCPQKRVYPGSYLLDRSFENYILKKELFTSVFNMTVVPVSQWLGRIVKQSFLREYPVDVIQNGIDIDVFSPQSLQEINEMRQKYNLKEQMSILLGVASTWERRKGLNDFIDLSQIIPSNWKIVLVGLKKQQIKLLPRNILGIERTENVQQLAILYSLATVFINPTWEDTFPTTNLEALACGTPVITYNTGGSVESVAESVGFIVEKGDVEGIKECVQEILKAGKDKYRAECRDRAVKLYDKNNRFEDYIRLYNRLLCGKINEKCWVNTQIKTQK